MIETGILAAVLVGISQMIKNIGLETKYIPLLNLVLGMIMSTFFMEDLGFQERIMHGIVVGLSASGLFDQTKLFD